MRSTPPPSAVTFGAPQRRRFAYQLAVVVDDAAMGVTEVVRGCDLLGPRPAKSTCNLLGLPTPRYAHIPLLMSPDGRRLSSATAT